MRTRSLLFLGATSVGAFALAALACGAGGFDPQSKVTSVRMFGVRADKPYAKPGDTVTFEVLATDGRVEKPRPLKVFWIPVVCVNPREDLYYLCFAPTQGAGTDAGVRLVPPFPTDGGVLDAGAPLVAGGNPLEQIPTGIDLGPFLPQGPTFQFRVPEDIIVPRLGSPPYGLAIVFNIACAGQVRLAERVGNAPQQVPIQCTDESGTPLGPDDFVIGINRVYTYADRTNANPSVEGVTLDGGAVDLAKGIAMPRCGERKRSDCPSISLDVKVPGASWEENPSESGTQREQIWVTYYSDLGTFKDDARLLYDTKTGRVSESDVEFRAPSAAATGTVWAVVHDNRAGAAFVTFPLRIE